MTDTTKPIDLSILEQGDAVVFSGQKALVNHDCIETMYLKAKSMLK